MKNTLALLLALVSPAWCALDYSRWAHPAGDYVIEYPSDWKRSIAMQAVNLQPPGRAGDLVVVSFERYPLGKGSPAKPKDYIKALLDPVGLTKKLDSRGAATVAGIKADKISLEETKEIKGEYGQKLPGPMKEIHLIVPHKGFYYVLSLRGVGQAYDEAVPEFDRMSQTLKLGAAPIPDKKQ
jgi:hypothetical protein